MFKLSDRFYRALCLCAGERSIKVRLADAWIRHLDELAVTRLPESAQQQFQVLHQAMYAIEPMPDEHPARAAARKMSARQATEHALAIVRIYKELIRVEHAQPLTENLSAVDVAEIAHSPEHDPQLN